MTKRLAWWIDSFSIRFLGSSLTNSVVFFFWFRKLLYLVSFFSSVVVVVFFPFLSLSQFSFRLQGGRSGAASSERLEQGATSYSCSRRSQLADDRQTKWKYQVLVSERVNERECSCCPLVVRPRTKQPKHAREPILEIVCQQEPDDNKPVSPPR